MFMSYETLNTSLRQSAAFMKSVFLAAALAIAAHAAERNPCEPPHAPPSQELSVSSNLTDQEVEPTFVLTFTPSRSLSAVEGRLAVLIGQMDISNLLTPTGDSLSYLPRILPLPAGESPVRVFLVTPSNEWRELAQLTLRVKAPAPADGGQAPPSSSDSAQTASAKKYSF